MRYGRPRPRRRNPARLRPKGNPRRGRKKLKRNPRLASSRAKSYTISEKEWQAELERRKRSRAAKKGAATRAKGGTKKKSAAKKKVAKGKAKNAAQKVSAKRRAAARKAAATRKKNKAKRSAAAKKAAATHKRKASAKRKPYKKAKRKTAKRKTAKKKTATRRRGKLTKAQRRAAALKGWRKRRSKKMARTVSKRRKSYKRKRKYAYSPKRRKPIGNQKVRRGYKGRRSKRKGRGGKPRRYGLINRRIAKHTRKGRPVRAHIRRRQGIRTNPMNALKGMIKEGVYTFGGILGIRALCHVLESKVFGTMATFQTGTMKKIAPMLPAGVAMLLAALSPKVIKGSPKLVQGLQAGATLVFFDAALKSLLSAVDAKGTISQYLLPGAPAATAGWGGYSEYVSSPMGLEVESAMALDEYVSSPVGLLGPGMGGGFDVEEALAGNEGNAFETGYAGGSLAKTVFSNY